MSIFHRQPPVSALGDLLGVIDLEIVEGVIPLVKAVCEIERALGTGSVEVKRAIGDAEHGAEVEVGLLHDLSNAPIDLIVLVGHAQFAPYLVDKLHALPPT